MAIGIGSPAPDAILTKDDARIGVALSEYMGEGPLVLLFFPLAFSSTCTKEMCTVAEDYSAFQALGASVIGISVDSPYTNARFARETGASFPILSDFNRTASRAYGVLRDLVGFLEGVSERAAFVIDRDRVVRYAWVAENPGLLPPLDAIKAAIAQI